MIDLYTWATPNGYKVSMTLEELQLDYEVKLVDIRNNEQFQPSFLEISPNNKIPAIVDDGLAVFDSGAILIYLAEKTGRLLPTAGVERTKVMQWLMFQMAHIGPMIGQLSWFLRSAPELVKPAIERYALESARLLNVMDNQLQRSEYIAGEFSIADIALYAWVSLAVDPIREQTGDVIGEVPSLARWLDLMGEKPAITKGMSIPRTPD